MNAENELAYLRLRNCELRAEVEVLRMEQKQLLAEIEAWKAATDSWRQIAILAEEKARILEENKGV